MGSPNGIFRKTPKSTSIEGAERDLPRYAWSFSPGTGSPFLFPVRRFFRKPCRTVRANPLIAASLPVTHPGQLPHLFRIDVLYLLGTIGTVTRDEAVSAHCRHEAHDSRPLPQGFEKKVRQNLKWTTTFYYLDVKDRGEVPHRPGAQEWGWVARGQGGAGRLRSCRRARNHQDTGLARILHGQ